MNLNFVLPIFFSNLTMAAQPNLLTEVQVNICESFKIVNEKLNLQSWKAKQQEKSYFIDNSHLDLYKSNLVFKVKIKSETENVEIILKYNAPIQFDEPVFHDKTENCEYDLHGSQKKLACKLSHIVSSAQFNSIRKSKKYLDLLNEDQLSWLNDLKIVLPSNLQMTTEFSDQDYSLKTAQSKINLGRSQSSNGAEFVEISTRVVSENEIPAQNALLLLLHEKNILLCSDQNALLTRLKLESFFKQTP